MPGFLMCTSVLGAMLFHKPAMTDHQRLTRQDITLGGRKKQHRIRHIIGGRKLTIKDRKSTRLNSSHVAISYAVFCLKKKKQKKEKKTNRANYNTRNIDGQEVDERIERTQH